MDSGISTSSEKSTGPVINQTGTDITTLVHTGRRSTWTSSHTYVRSSRSKSHYYLVKFRHFF